jgi:hypothetical protein
MRSKVFCVPVIDCGYNTRQAFSNTTATNIGGEGVGVSVSIVKLWWWSARYNKSQNIYTANIERRAAAGILPINADSMSMSNNLLTVTSIYDVAKRKSVPREPSSIAAKEFVSGVNGLLQPIRLNSEDSQLQYADEPQYPRQHNQPPIGPRFLVSLFLILGGFFSSLWGGRILTMSGDVSVPR